jgi:hypothetical protein
MTQNLCKLSELLVFAKMKFEKLIFLVSIFSITSSHYDIIDNSFYELSATDINGNDVDFMTFEGHVSTQRFSSHKNSKHL